MKKLKTVESIPNDPQEDFYYYNKSDVELTFQKKGIWTQTSPFFVNPIGQTITFDEIADQRSDHTSLALMATSSSGLPVSYTSSNTAVATISGSVINFVTHGTSVITASQAGDARFSPAPDVARMLFIIDANQDSDGDGIPDVDDPFPNSQAQTITFEAIADRQIIDGDLTLSATASSGLPVTYSTPDTSLLTINGNVVSFTGTSSVFTQQVSITASQSGGVDGDNDWLAAADVQQTFDLSDLDSDNDGVTDSQDSYNTQLQTITFEAIADRQIIDGDLTLGATASSGLTVTYSSASPYVTFDPTNPGVAQFANEHPGAAFTNEDVTITASQAGGLNSSNNTDWHPAPDVSKVFKLSDLDSDGDGTPDSRDLNPNSAPQTITFNDPGDQMFSDGSLVLNAVSDSNLTVSYASSNTSVATVSGNTLTFVSSSGGTTTITASQTGNVNYLPATPVTQDITIVDNVTDSDNDGIPDSQDEHPDSQAQTISFGGISDRHVVDGNLTLTATSTSGLKVIYSTPNTDLVTINGNSLTAPAWAVFNGKTQGGNYVAFSGEQITIIASQSGGLDSNGVHWKAAVDVQQVFGLSDTDSDGDGILDSQDAYPNSQTQTITFNKPANLLISSVSQYNPYILQGSTDSGLSVAYSSSDESIATIINGNELNVVSASSGGDTITITASQAGGYSSSNSTDWKAAVDVPQDITIFDDITDTDGDLIPDYTDIYPGESTRVVGYSHDNAMGHNPTLQKSTVFRELTYPAQVAAFGDSWQPQGMAKISSSKGAYTLFLKKDGELLASGKSNFGQFGQTPPFSYTKYDLHSRATEVVDMGAGHNHSVYVKSDGSLWGAGWNQRGELGLGDFNQRNVYTQITLPSANVVSVAAGYWHTAYINSSNELWFMGWDFDFAANTFHNIPILLDTDVVKVWSDGGGSYLFFKKTDGSIWGWGGNSHGELGTGTTAGASTPFQFSTPNSWEVDEMSLSWDHTLFTVINPDNGQKDLYGMGDNWYGRLGLDQQIDYLSPVLIDSDVVSFSAGYWHSIYLKADQTIWTMGLNAIEPTELEHRGVLGVNSTDETHYPPKQITNLHTYNGGQQMPLSGVNPWTKVFAGVSHSWVVAD